MFIYVLTSNLNQVLRLGSLAPGEKAIVISLLQPLSHPHFRSITQPQLEAPFSYSESACLHILFSLRHIAGESLFPIFAESTYVEPTGCFYLN